MRTHPRAQVHIRAEDLCRCSCVLSRVWSQGARRARDVHRDLHREGCFVFCCPGYLLYIKLIILNGQQSSCLQLYFSRFVFLSARIGCCRGLPAMNPLAYYHPLSPTDHVSHRANGTGRDYHPRPTAGLGFTLHVIRPSAGRVGCAHSQHSAAALVFG